jgi:hypothetical protein
MDDDHRAIRPLRAIGVDVSNDASGKGVADNVRDSGVALQLPLGLIAALVVFGALAVIESIAARPLPTAVIVSPEIPSTDSVFHANPFRLSTLQPLDEGPAVLITAEGWMLTDSR